jgi:hypothetical protein
MEEAVRALLRRHAFRPGRQDADRIAGDFAVPLIIYNQDRIALFRTKAEIAASLVAYSTALEAAGVVRVDPVVLEITPGGPDRVSSLVDWRHIGADGCVTGTNRSRTFFRRIIGRGAPLVELVEYLSIGTRTIFGDAATVARRVH